ncbi:MAG: protoheme IX farnesyltransferase [Rubripirellula sp.]|nr:protoheme IX farnesyltransferase [Rubripirellula sp.]
MATDLLTADPPNSVSPMCATGDSLVAPSINEEQSANVGRTPVTSRGGVSGYLSDLIQLTKPRIVVMILVTTAATAMIGAGGLVPGGQLLWLLIATAAVAGSAGAANQIWERVIDQRMTRTANRPLAADRMHAIVATCYMLTLLTFGTLMLYSLFGPTPAIVGLATWALYVLVYTPMKTRTTWNTTVGAVAGALPVLIGYTAMGGTLTGLSGWLLVGVLVAWQYPHFMSIAWLYRRQYGEAGFRMTTTEDPSGWSAGIQSVSGSLVLMGFATVLCFLPGGWIQGAIAAIAAVGSATPMLIASVGFMSEPNDQQARKLLRSSLLVLPAVLAICTLRLFW